MTNIRKKRLVKCVYMEKVYSKRGQIKFKKMFWIYSTKKYQIFKCTGFPEHEMCLYGGINFENQRNLVFDIGLKCTEKIVSKNFEKMKCTVIFGTRNVSIWRGKRAM